LAKTARQIDEGIFYQYARNLGFGQPTYIDLPGEVSGTLKRPSNWSRTTLTSMSIGYEVSVTPLQLLSAYSALANGGVLVEPYVVAERRSITGEQLWTQRPDSIRRALKPETTQALQKAFVQTVESGTATSTKVEGLQIAGKTGTALKVTGGRYSSDQARASFVGYFPADDPKVAMLVIVGEPETSIYGGAVAAPIFQNIARRWIGTFPDVVDHIVASADTSSGESSPPAAPAETKPPGLPARLASSNTDTMPDLTGLSTRQSVTWLRSRGIDVRLYGHGTVQKQSPSAGQPLPSRAMLTGASN